MLGLLSATIRRILALLPKSKVRQSALILLLLFISSVLDLAGLSALIPLILVVLDPNVFEAGTFMGDLYLASGIEGQNTFIVAFAGAILLVVVAKNMLGLWFYFLFSRFTFGIQHLFSVKLFNKYFNRGLTFIRESNSNRIARDVNGVPAKFSNELLLPLLNVTNELLVLLLIVSALILYNPMVILMVAAIVLPTFWLFYRFSRNRVQFYAEKMFEISPKINKTLYESFFGYTDIKVSGTEAKFQKAYDADLGSSLRYNILNQTFKMAPTKVVETSMILGILVIICTGIFLFDDRNQLLTLLSVFALAAYRTLPSANRLMVSLIQIKAHQYTLDVLDRVNMDLKEEYQEDVEISMKNSIRLDAVSFKYAGTNDYVLKEVDLQVKKGERVGIVGKSGSGKSTLMNLLLLFYEADSGGIYSDDLKLGLEKQKSWRKLIGYVPQEVFLVDSNLRENVAFGSEEDKIDDERVMDALKRAQLDELVASMDQGIYTGIGERGSRLSGGQRQRVGIARALYHGAEILLFDEATSALDPETERDITESIHDLADGELTMIIIAHRVTTLKFCNRIVELEEGSIKGEYAYEELLERSA